MRLLDTMVLVAGLDPAHSLHARSVHHLRSVSSPDVYVPSAAILELDLELKSHGFGREDRQEAAASLLGYIHKEKVLPITLETISELIRYEHIAGYFDALIGSTAKLHDASIISKDPAFREMGLEIEW